MDAKEIIVGPQLAKKAKEVSSQHQNIEKIYIVYIGPTCIKWSNARENENVY